MTAHIDPYDIMRYERTVSEYLERGSDSGVASSPFQAQLEHTRRVIGTYLTEGFLEYSYPVASIAIAGRALESARGLPVVTPTGEEIGEEGHEAFARRLLNEDNPWETLYEIEIAGECAASGLDTKLVHEGDATGPDVFVNVDSDRIDIECKRRRPHDPADELEGFYSSVANRIEDNIELGDDSYFIELTSDGPLEERAVDSLVDLAIHVVREGAETDSVVVDDVEYRILLRDQFSGTKELDISNREFKRWLDISRTFPNLVHAFLSPFEVGEMSPGLIARAEIKASDSGRIVSRNALVFDFNFPTIDSEYVNRIVDNTIKRGMSDLSGRSPAVLFVHLPAYDTADMERFLVKDGRGASVPQLARLKDRLEGKLKISSSVNAIALTTTHFLTKGNEAEIQRSGIVMENLASKDPLPDRFRRLLVDGLG